MCIRNCVRTANANSIDVSRYCCWQSMHVSVWPTALGNNNIMTWLSFRISSNNNNSQIPFALEQLITALHMNICSLSLISILNRVGTLNYIFGIKLKLLAHSSRMYINCVHFWQSFIFSSYMTTLHQLCQIRAAPCAHALSFCTHQNNKLIP